jgi:outer membrane immunogenic protein
MAYIESVRKWGLPMKKLFLATTALVALVTFGPAEAADLAPAYKAAPVARPACSQFGGVYVGANGGWAYHDRTWTDRDNWIDNFSNDFNTSSITNSRNGGTAGVQAGYNWQRGCTLFGVEIDANWAGLKGSSFYSPTSAPGTVLTLDDNLNWFATARTRTGIIVDDVLLFVTGGAAYANIKHNFTVTDANSNTSESFSAPNSRWGWVGGVGVEWAWSDRVSIKSEALYIRFADVTNTFFSTAGGQNVTFDHHDSMWVSRIGINVKLGAGPVVARY